MKPYYKMIVRDMKDENQNPIESAPHAAQTLYMPLDEPVGEGAMLRRKK